jgi:hypothetical protein
VIDSLIEKQRLLPDAAIETKPILSGLYHNYKAKTA